MDFQQNASKMQERGRVENVSNMGRGRRKGVKNRFTNLRRAFLDAFQVSGGSEELARWASKPRNQKDFYRMLSKMLPRDIEISSPEGEHKVLPSLEIANRLLTLVKMAMQRKEEQEKSVRLQAQTATDQKDR